MKKLFKGFIIAVALNFIAAFVFILFVVFAIFIPSMNKSNVTLKDLMNSKINDKEYSTLEKSIVDKAGVLGSKAGKSVGSALENMIPKPTINASNQNQAPYPYPSLDSVVNNNDAAAQKGIEQGLETMQSGK